MIKVSVVIATRNEEDNLPRCLQALKDFDEIIIHDSGSVDKTIEIAKHYNVRVENFEWNGCYPKKRQYFLEHIQTKHNYIFFVDADEQVTPALVAEIKNRRFSCHGYFIRGQYNWNGKLLQYGLQNNKLALFDRRKFYFPVVDDLHSFSMGEMEGHYQPVLKDEYKHGKIGALQEPLIHFAYDDKQSWLSRHQRYALWEAGMIKNKAYPSEDKVWRDGLKLFFRVMPCRGLMAFVHSYIFKLGFLDGVAGWHFAQSRRYYYKMVANALKSSKALDK